MIAIAIAVFREFLEISIFLSFFGVISKNIKDFRILFTAGLLSGIFGAFIIAFFTDHISESLDGMGQEVFDAIIILVTVVMIISTLVWMKNHSKKIKASVIEIGESYDSSNASKFMLVSLIASTIFREGAEIVLIVHSISSVQGDHATVYLKGFLIGASAGLAVGVAIFYGLFRYAAKYIFSICSFLMTFIAAGLSAEASKKLISTGYINALSEKLWDTSFIIPDESIVGKILKIFFGYTSKPTAMEFVFYFGTLLIILLSEKIFSAKSKRKP
jgi:high-affinity iron transporter